MFITVITGRGRQAESLPQAFHDFVCSVFFKDTIIVMMYGYDLCAAGNEIT